VVFCSVITFARTVTERHGQWGRNMTKRAFGKYVYSTGVRTCYDMDARNLLSSPPCTLLPSPYFGSSDMDWICTWDTGRWTSCEVIPRIAKQRKKTFRDVPKQVVRYVGKHHRFCFHLFSGDTWWETHMSFFMSLHTYIKSTLNTPRLTYS